jgi:hypothetical protein
MVSDLRKLIQDQGRLTLYRKGQIMTYTVGQLAQEALDAAKQR